MSHEDSISSEHSTSDRALRLIGLYKFAKTILLLLVAAGAFGLVHPSVAAQAERLIAALAASGSHRTISRILAEIFGLSAGKLEALGIGAILYASLFLVEGIGLWRGRRWAEYLTVIATASFIPLELWELSRRLTVVRGLALVINVSVVGYLIRLLRSRETRDGERPKR